MAYHEALAARLRALLPEATERRMFGGRGWMERGNLVAGVSHDDLIVRVLPEETERWLRAPGAHPMMPGRGMKGWLEVSANAVVKDPQLKARVARSRSAAGRLPAK